MENGVSAFAPASVSNLACGFDVLGFALESAGDVVHARFDDSVETVVISDITGDDGRLPRAVRKNTAGMAVMALLEKIKPVPAGISLVIEKKMPFASGMGSSAASAAAAVKAVNHLLGDPLDETALLECIIAAEATISGGAHADNAAPALLGGLVLAREVDPPDILSLPVPEGLCYVLLHPRVAVETKQARQALPASIALKTGVSHWANTAALVHALHTADFALLARAMRDFIAEPLRRRYIPHYEAMKQAALEAGALTFNISGSGPAVFSFCSSRSTADRVARILTEFCDRERIDHGMFVGEIRSRGAVITGATR